MLSSNESKYDIAQNRQRLSKMLQLHGYSACREALVLLEDHYTSSTKYESIEDFISQLNKIITFETDTDSSIIDPNLAHIAIDKLRRPPNLVNIGDNNVDQGDNDDEDEFRDDLQVPQLPASLPIKVKNVQCDDIDSKQSFNSNRLPTGDKQSSEFNIHYNFLFKKLSALPIFQGDFKLTTLATLTGSSQPSIRCICFGLLVKDLSKIDGYMLIDSTGRVPVRITPDTAFRNRLAYTNCIVLVEGVYVNPDDILFAANIGLPPILLEPVQDKSLACLNDNFVVILKDLYLDDEDVCKALDMLFTGYNSMEEPPLLFILIGNFTRNPCAPDVFRIYMKRLIRILRSCDNLSSCHFVFVPGPTDTSLRGQPREAATNEEEERQQGSNSKTTTRTRTRTKTTSTTTTASTTATQIASTTTSMPRPALTKEQLPLNLLLMSNFDNVHLSTNPAHIYFGERLITVVAQPYLKELRKNLLHDLSDHREELMETAKQIILSNGHLSAGIAKTFHSSMNLWHRPDLLILADNEAIGNKYDYSLSKMHDTSFATLPSFSLQYNQFKVYYVKSGEIEDSQVSLDAYQDIEQAEADAQAEEPAQMVEPEPSELD